MDGGLFPTASLVPKESDGGASESNGRSGRRGRRVVVL